MIWKAARRGSVRYTTRPEGGSVFIVTLRADVVPG